MRYQAALRPVGAPRIALTGLGKPPQARVDRLQAGDGNRTRPRSLEGFCATTTLRPRTGPDYRRGPWTPLKPSAGRVMGQAVRLSRCSGGKIQVSLSVRTGWCAFLRESLTLRVSGGRTAPTRARTALRSLDSNLAELRDDVHLLVSELVTNSVLHAAADRVELLATSDPAGVHVEVSDPGPGFDHTATRTPRTTGNGGYGLLLVDQVANRWGAGRDPLTRVWFEIDRVPGR